ncbi:MAG: trehalose-phosphatase [Nitrospinae bacterium]|nr:trehalose-phosphatase [Nitrospinota bacterium]
MRKIHRLCSLETLFAFDFDGTLSKISARPERTQLARKTSGLLKSLGELAPVAIISGRNSSDLKPRLNFKPRYLIGNHGIDELEWEKFLGKSTRQICRSWKNQIREFLADNKMPGVELEDNRFTLAIHYRHSRDKRKVKAAVLGKASLLSPPPRIGLGKSVINIIPAALPHKGDAFRKLIWLSRAPSAFYIGDDDTDEDIFALSLPRVLTARVGHKKNSSAGFYIRRQSEINKFLQRILEVLNNCRPAKRKS